MPDLQLARLQDHLGQLKLFTLQTRLETLLQEASGQELTYADFLDRLLAEELAAKSEKYVAMRTVMARFPYRKTLENFDFSFQPSLDRKKLQELACVSRKPEALHPFDFFRLPPHAGAADSSILRHVIVRSFLIMLPVISALPAFVAGLFRSRASLGLEHLALRHQLAVYQQTVHRPRLHSSDRVLWAWLSRLWPGWRDALAFVQPRTVIAW